MRSSNRKKRPPNQEDVFFGVLFEVITVCINVLLFGIFCITGLVFASVLELTRNYILLSIVAGGATYGSVRYALIQSDYHKLYDNQRTEVWSSIFTIGWLIERDSFVLMKEAEEFLVEWAVERIFNSKSDVEVWQSEAYPFQVVLFLLVVSLGISATTIWFFTGGAQVIADVTMFNLKVIINIFLAILFSFSIIMIFSNIEPVRPTTWHTSLLVGMSRIFPPGIAITTLFVVSNIPSLDTYFKNEQFSLTFLILVYFTIFMAIVIVAHCLLIVYDTVYLKRKYNDS